MARTENIQALTGGLTPDLKLVFQRIFDYVLKNVRFGRPEDASENFQANFITGTTPAVANTEFSIVHNRTVAPYLALPVLDLQTVGTKIPRLTVTKAADAMRVYLSSPDTNAPVCLFVEGP